jgi:FkbM family methyltransferase
MLEDIFTKIWYFIKIIYYYLALNKLTYVRHFLKKFGNFILKILSYFKKMELHPNGSWGTGMRFLLGFYEPESVAICKKFVKPGTNVLDVGGDIGYYSRIFSELVKESGRVYVFEPHPEAFSILLKNISNSKYKNIFPVKMAISDKKGKMDFFEMEGFGKHSLYDVSKYDSKTIIKKKLTAEVTTLDEFLEKEGNPKIDFLKIDVEGGEVGVLNGMKNTIAKSDKLAAIIEFNASAVLAGGGRPSEFIGELSKFGFDAKEISENRTLKEIDKATYLAAEQNSINLFCVRK